MARSQDLLRIEIDPQQMAEVTNLLKGINNGSSRAVMRAINRTVTGCKTDTKKAIYGEINLTQQRIARDISTKTATMLVQTASVTTKGKHIELIEFGAKITRSGVSVQVKRKGGRKTMPGAFIQRGESGGLHVMMRKSPMLGKGHPIGMPASGYYYTHPARWPEAYRYPAYKLFGPSIPEIFSNSEVIGSVLTKANERMRTNLDHEAEYLIRLNQPTSDGSEE